MVNTLPQAIKDSKGTKKRNPAQKRKKSSTKKGENSSTKKREKNPALKTQQAFYRSSLLDRSINHWGFFLRQHYNFFSLKIWQNWVYKKSSFQQKVCRVLDFWGCCWMNIVIGSFQVFTDCLMKSLRDAKPSQKDWISNSINITHVKLSRICQAGYF